MVEPNNFCLEDYVSYFSTSTRASSQNKIKSITSTISRLNATKHFYFNRVIKALNALPPQHPFLSIKKHIFSNLDRPYSWHIVCPCSKYSCLPSSSFQFNFNWLLLIKCRTKEPCMSRIGQNYWYMHVQLE